MPKVPDAQGRWAGHMLREAGASPATTPGLRIIVDRVSEEPVPALFAVAEGADLLVPGSGGLRGRRYWSTMRSERS